MGRRSIPPHLHLVNGNPSKKPLKDLLTIGKRPVGIPDCPETLIGDARAEWDRITPLLEALGLISSIDMAALTLYCDAWGDFLRAQRKLEALGDDGYVMNTSSGYKQIGPWLSIKNRAAEAVNKYKQEFGLSPADWSRVDPNPQGDLFGNGKEDTPAPEKGAARFFPKG